MCTSSVDHDVNKKDKEISEWGSVFILMSLPVLHRVEAGRIIIQCDC